MLTSSPQPGSFSGPSASNTPSHLAHSAPPLPPQPVASSSHSSSNSTSYAYESTRRRSIGGQSPPRYYGPAAPPEPQQSTTFASRQMPPPSPSQQQLHPAGYGSQRPPPFSGGRELPGLGSHRPGGGMSISSILGTDAPSQPPPSRPQHSPTAQSPNAPGMRPPSPRRGQSAGSRMELNQNQQWRRPQTPEKHSVPSALRLSENPGYAAESSPRYYGQGPRGSPEYQRSVPAQQQPHYHTHPTPPRSSHAYHRSSPTNVSEHRPIDERIPPRPTSQPASYALPPREGEHRDAVGPGQMQPHYSGHAPERTPQEDPRSQPGPGFGERHHHAVSSGERAVTAQPGPRTAYTPPHDQRQDGNNILHRNLHGREPVREEASRDYGAPRREESSGPFRTGFRGQYYNQPPTSAPPGEAPRSHPQPFDHYRPAPEASQFGGQDSGHGFGRLLPQHGAEHQSPERRRDGMTSSGGDPRSHNAMYDPQHRNSGGEEMQQSRSLLGISSDPNRRGRASPLPQAVQGAQAQLVGPGTDPHVKSEFGRLFPGLGSGLGGPGNMTPSRQSPVPQRMRDDRNSMGPGESDGIRMTRVASGSGRGRGRRVKDENSTPEGGHDGRGTPAGSGGRGKRGKGVHHHHVRPAHHHHIHKHEEPPVLQPVSTTAGQSASVTPSAHHHHHIHPASHHHHHHPPRQNLPVINIPKPTLKITSQSVLDAIKHKPRNHLGNALYAVKFTTPPMASTPLHDRYGYFMQYEAARRFTTADENCTFTIRVPRDFLTAVSREKLCVDRYVYGTEVFTEDSDPIVAAIHSGWIRGDWGPDVDQGLMDIPPPAPDDQPVPTEMTEVPKSPMVPPAHKDAHIKLLILPALLKYGSTLRFGVRSRKWGDNHDGVSYMIHSIKWVDEGLGGGHERRGLGRKKRARAEIEGRGDYPVKRIGVESSRMIGVAAA